MATNCFSRFCIAITLFACILSLTPFIESSATISKDPVGGNLWCIANPHANPQYLLDTMNVLCNVVDCRSIRLGGACYDPNTIVNHASVVFNLYFQPRSSNPHTCNFGGDAMLTTIDPSYGSCIFPSS
ncbi:glucan endo-1,3-beta-glucosidase [Dendrobium catenatum]|uniref:glucan endo-1,3-beta-glucosidase n=1 Tax=Dendrobium catenatum TaxID=906689 RepID=UPI0009F369D0|nr:glucan endo-1,3-beta-glucosidase [Dendrobium catenatum]